MAQPPAYTPAADFSAENTQVGAKLDIEFNALKATLDVLLTDIALLQRDDTALLNSSVHPQSLTVETLSLLSGTWNPRGAWLTATAYTKLDSVTESGLSYLCAVTHTSGTFATDLAAGKWIGTGGYVTAAMAQTDLTDGVASYTGKKSTVLQVNAAETGLETGYIFTVLTAAAYAAIGTKDTNTVYLVTA